MFLLDEIYKNNRAYPSHGSALEKFLFYRGDNNDIDVDVCINNIENYIFTNPCIKKKSARIVGQKSFNKSNKKYEIVDGETTFRGETLINCMQILLQIVNFDNKGEKIRSDDYEEILSGIENSKILTANNEKLRTLLDTFIIECYSEGNFFAIPFISRYSLNCAKGKLKQAGYQGCLIDSADTYFNVCFNYFSRGLISCQLVELIDGHHYEIWKNRYLNNWGLFIKDNMFQDFVDENNNPIQMWNMSGDFSKDLENYLNRAISFLSKRRERITAEYQKKKWVQKVHKELKIDNL